MAGDGIEWDDRMGMSNKRKHRISFETAQYVFADPKRLERLDMSSGVHGEYRTQVLRMVGEILLVVYTERGNNIHIISARLANKAEGAHIMAIIQSKIRVGQKPSERWRVECLALHGKEIKNSNSR